jgi:hypothetical protein
MARPRFLADEDLRYAIVAAVRRLEPAAEIATVVEEGRSGSTDAEILELARSTGRIKISHDVNTMRAEAERRIADGRGIVGLFLAAQSSVTRVIAESIVLAWAASEADEWLDRIVYLPF